MAGFSGCELLHSSATEGEEESGFDVFWPWKSSGGGNSFSQRLQRRSRNAGPFRRWDGPFLFSCSETEISEPGGGLGRQGASFLGRGLLFFEVGTADDDFIPVPIRARKWRQHFRLSVDRLFLLTKELETFEPWRGLRRMGCFLRGKVYDSSTFAKGREGSSLLNGLAALEKAGSWQCPKP